MPQCQAWFAAYFKDIEQVERFSTFDLLGHSGKALLRTEVNRNTGGGSLVVRMCPPKSPTLGTLIYTAVPIGADPKPMELHGRKGRYGDLIATRGAGPLHYTVRRGGTDFISLSLSEQTSQLVLHTVMGDNQLACASRCLQSEMLPDVDHLEVRVSPGADAVLVLLCVLGAVIFSPGPNSELPMRQPPAKTHDQ